MAGLGVVEVIRADTSFASEAAQPALPGAERTSVGATPRRITGKKINDALESLLASNLEMGLQAARSSVSAVRSSTTLAALGHSLESMGDREQAILVATEALEMCAQQSGEKLLDPLAARIALEILIRADRIDEAMRLATALPLGPQLKLLVGANLASIGRLDDAHSFVDDVTIPERDPVMGFINVVEGKDAAAVSCLRAALRRAPNDADSALNLSIALWRLGSHKKAVSAALQATRTAPGREDISLHYLELLLAEGEFPKADREVVSILTAGAEATGRLLIIQARAKLAMDDFDHAMRLLERAANAARSEDDPDRVAEIRSNIVRLRASRGNLDRNDAIEQLLRIHNDAPTCGVVVINLAQVVNRKKHAKALRDAFQKVEKHQTAERSAFILYQIATLEGDNESAASHAVDWLSLEPDNPDASAAAMVALGIGQERWDQAAEIAVLALAAGEPDRAQINNAAYVLAMAGRGKQAVEILTPHVTDFVLKATLGLTYLSCKEIDLGMRLYREAANEAEKRGDDSRSLMTAYQALVVRQLGLLDASDTAMITALSLPPVALPDDWSDRPEFLRLHHVAKVHGYAWPLTI